MNEVQDFSMPNKNKQISSNKGKLDSMLDKLMKRKNCVCISRNYLFNYLYKQYYVIYL